jgi:hypothetical protein
MNYQYSNQDLNSLETNISYPSTKGLDLFEGSPLPEFGNAFNFSRINFERNLFENENSYNPEK